MSFESGSEAPSRNPGGDSVREALSRDAFSNDTPIIDYPPTPPDSHVGATGGAGTEIRSSGSVAPERSDEPVVRNNPNGFSPIEIIGTPKRPEPQSTVSAQGEVRKNQKMG